MCSFSKHHLKLRTNNIKIGSAQNMNGFHNVRIVESLHSVACILFYKEKEEKFLLEYVCRYI